MTRVAGVDDLLTLGRSELVERLCALTGNERSALDRAKAARAAAGLLQQT
jgi:hypothetical protein